MSGRNRYQVAPPSCLRLWRSPAASTHHRSPSLICGRGNIQSIVPGGRHARYVPSPAGSIWGDRSQGHLVYASGDGLYAVAFDLANLKTNGTPISMVPKVAGTQFGAVDAVVSGNGTLAYMSAGTYGGERALVWVDRKGHETPIAAEPRPYVYPRLSPDGTASRCDGRGSTGGHMASGTRSSRSDARDDGPVN